MFSSLPYHVRDMVYNYVDEENLIKIILCDGVTQNNLPISGFNDIYAKEIISKIYCNVKRCYDLMLEKCQVNESMKKLIFSSDHLEVEEGRLSIHRHPNIIQAVYPNDKLEFMNLLIDAIRSRKIITLGIIFQKVRNIVLENCISYIQKCVKLSRPYSDLYLWIYDRYMYNPRYMSPYQYWLEYVNKPLDGFNHIVWEKLEQPEKDKFRKMANDHNCEIRKNRFFAIALEKGLIHTNLTKEEIRTFFTSLEKYI